MKFIAKKVILIAEPLHRISQERHNWAPELIGHDDGRFQARQRFDIFDFLLVSEFGGY